MEINFSLSFFLIFFFFVINITSAAISICQSDFQHGTYRILNPGVYQLCENIVFNPNPSTTLDAVNNDAFAWYSQNDSFYPTNGAPFILGFFTAISVESDNVEINLNNFEIRMHDYFHFQQRFFSIIEIANSPSEKGQGQADFGNIKYVSNIKIYNGKLGKSSHHGIHSNGVSNLTISNLRIYDFEVAGIHLNNFKNVKISNVEIGPSLTNVPVNAYYANARFLLMKLRSINARIPNDLIKFQDRSSAVSITYIYNNLLRAMNLLFSYFNHPQDVTSRKLVLLDQTRQMFESKTKLPDGSSLYGILLNSWGPAVFGFGDSPNRSSTVEFENISIHDLYHSTKEVIGYYHLSNNQRVPLRGPFGEQIDIFNLCSNFYPLNPSNLNNSLNDSYLINLQSNQLPLLPNCTYRTNFLLDGQVAVALKGDRTKNETGLTFISSDFLQWIQNKTPFNSGAHIKCNGDIMGHTVKGTIGIRADNIDNLIMNNIKVFNIQNETPLGTKLCGGYVDDSDSGANFGTIDGFMGTNLRGISIVNSNNVQLNNFNVFNLQSFYGDVIGLDIFDSSQNVIINGNNNIITNLNAGSKLLTSLESQKSFNPNHDPFVCGIDFDDTSNVNSNSNIQISNLQGYDA